MVVKFVKCRRVDDHSRTEDIAVSALQHLTGWEPIPEEELRAEREAEEAARVSEMAGVEVTKQPPAPERPPSEPEPTSEGDSAEASTRSTTRKSRRAATQE